MKKTDHEYWDEVRPLLPDFMKSTYEDCEGWQCGVTARYVLVRFQKHIGKTGDISYHSFYNELRRLGYDLPVVKGFENKTRIKGVVLREGLAPF